MLRSVAVLLAAPLVALPTGGAEDEASTTKPAEMATRITRIVPVSPIKSSNGSAAPIRDEARARHARAAGARAAPRPPRSSTPAPVRVSVDCAEDGCVVQDGLDVLVVGP